MLEAIRRFLKQRTSAGSEADPATPPSHDELQLAASALLLEIGYADGEFSSQERAHVEASLARHFNLDPTTVHDLLALADAERRESIDHFQFTQLINEQLDAGQKLLLAEVMWGVILADGKVGDHEAYLLRKIGRLLDLEPGYLADARRTATSRSAPNPEA